MRNILLSVALLCGPSAAFAQSAQVLSGGCGTAGYSNVRGGAPPTQDTTGLGCVGGTITTTPKTITWIAPTSASISASATVVAAGPKVSIITNATAGGGGNLTLDLSGGTVVDKVGIVLQPGATFTVTGQPVGTAITGICSTGTCTVGVQSGS